jgi:hypothetical protein
MDDLYCYFVYLNKLHFKNQCIIALENAILSKRSYGGSVYIFYDSWCSRNFKLNITIKSCLSACNNILVGGRETFSNNPYHKHSQTIHTFEI